MRNRIFRAVVGMGIASAAVMGITDTSYAQSTGPLSQFELNELADLSFKSNRSELEEVRYGELRYRLKKFPPVEAVEGESEPTFATTQQLKLPYLEIAPDFGITRLSGSIKYTDTWYSGESDKASIDGTAARIGLDIRYNIPIDDNVEFFAGGWTFGNFGGSTGLHNEEKEELRITDHLGVLSYSVNNFVTAYTGVSLPFYEHFCACFGAVQFSLNPYVGARVGQIDLELDYTNGNGSTKEKETKTFVTPLAGIELKARSGRVFHSGLHLGAAIGYQYQGGTDASIEGEVGGVSGKFDFDVKNQQHIYGSLRVGYSF
ncbi:MAG: hypothetical protein V7703_16730 [Hyphomicrobiales bacterium]